MKNMFEILKDTLQSGMEIKNERELSNKWKFSIAYDGMQAATELPKTTAPGHEVEVCKTSINNAMSTMYINAGNLVEAKAWLDGERWNIDANEKKIRISFRIYDKDGNDVTDKNDWYIGIDGILYFETTDIDCPLMEAEEYRYEIETQ